MLCPVVRRLLVTIAVLLTSTVAFSRSWDGFFEPEEEIIDDLGSYSPVYSLSANEDSPSRNEEVSNRWIPSRVFGNGEKSTAQPSMMDTFEKFKRQAVRSVVPGDETVSLTERGSTLSKFNSLVSWQTATLISILCVGAVVIGVILGVLYWPKAAFGERRDSSVKSKKGLIGSSIEGAGDRSLAHSAQMYHYHQQKQQMLAMEQAAGKVRSLDSNSDSEGEYEEPDVNVYECPGLASTSEMEVRNPLFEGDYGESGGVSLAKESK